MMRRLLAVLATTAFVLLPAAGSAAAPVQSPGCEVVASELTWGFKESFRAYIDGSIANGEWTVADGASYATPTFGFTSVAGRFDPRDPSGYVEFPGTVHFTGHGGILDTTIANPVLLLRGPEGAALLLLDVSGPTMEGDEFAVEATPFVSIDLSGQDLAPVDGIVTIDAAPTTLTADGALAFPNYEAGTAFDPVSATIDIGECTLTGQPSGTDTVDGGGLVPWHLILLATGLVLVAGIVVLVVVLTRRRP